MATLDSNAVLTVRTTIGSKVANLGISDGQLIFVRDKRQVALDFDGRRTFYNLIEELATDGARLSLLAPVTGAYYFVVETGVLWAYQDDWIRLTTSPEEITEALEEAIQSGEFKGEKGDKGDPGAPGVSGVYIGSGAMPDGYNVQIDPDGDLTGMDILVSNVIAALPKYEGEVVAL